MLKFLTFRILLYAIVCRNYEFYDWTKKTAYTVV